MRSPVIFVSGPLNAPSVEGVVANIRKANEAAFKLVEYAHGLGLRVRLIIPHNNTGWWLTDDAPEEMREHARKYDRLFLGECMEWIMTQQVDAVYSCGNSTGADCEQLAADVAQVKLLKTQEEYERFLRDWYDCLNF